MRRNCSALDQLVAWHHEGKLATEFPAASRLLAELSDEDLVVAGQLLSRLDPDVVPGAPTVTVALTGHGTVASIVAPLTAELARHGLLLRPIVGDFDSYVSDLGDAESELYRCGAALVLCVLDATVIFDEVPVPWTIADVRTALERKLTLIEQLVAQFIRAGSGTLVLNTMPLPHHHVAQLIEHVSRAELGALWREANARLLRLVTRHDPITVIDLDPLVAAGVPAVDARLSRYARVNLSAGLISRYAREVGHLASQLTGRTRKCLVLDLDETLWGGVLAEDGVEGIEVDGPRRGEAFNAFQRVVKQVGSQGVLLAVASKNDPAPVRQVLREHPGMTLREADFVRIQANWEPKHGNLIELADTLNLSLDSFVFVDDSAHECGLVRLELPEVAVVQLTGEPATHIEKLLRDNWFGVRQLTKTDRARAGTYQQEVRREDFRKSFTTVQNYLNELDVRVRLDTVHEREIPRVAQLTMRTNQFNLTTKRLRPDAVRALATAPESSVLTVSSTDRFGDNGLVGAMFLSTHDEHVHIDNFLLSCRVFARGIERACLAAVLRHARESGAAAVVGHYRRTAKNGKFDDFYPGNGFSPVSGDGVATAFRHDLAEIPPPPTHVLLTGSFGGTDG